MMELPPPEADVDGATMVMPFIVVSWPGCSVWPPTAIPEGPFERVIGVGRTVIGEPLPPLPGCWLGLDGVCGSEGLLGFDGLLGLLGFEGLLGSFGLDGLLGWDGLLGFDGLDGSEEAPTGCEGPFGLEFGGSFGDGPFGSDALLECPPFPFPFPGPCELGVGVGKGDRGGLPGEGDDDGGGSLDGGVGVGVCMGIVGVSIALAACRAIGGSHKNVKRFHCDIMEHPRRR